MVKALSILVVGRENSGLTSFIQSASDDIEEGPLERNVSRIRDSGRLDISDDLVLYIFGLPRTLNTLGRFSMTFEAIIPYAGLIVLVDSAHQEVDQENKWLLQELQWLNEPFNPPCIIALSRQDLPNARSPQEIREVLSIPDDIKVLGYDLNKPATTKQIVLELMELFPSNETIQQMIDGLKAKITD
jgi:signal recognition particle receptor subunit beta